MGAAVSKNAATASLDAITNVCTDIISNSTVSATQGQGIIISGNDGGVTVGNITQEQTLTLNTSALLTAMSTSTAQQDLTANLSQTAKSVVSGINFAQYSDAQNNVSLFLKESIDIATNITQICQSDIGQTQTIVITNNTGKVQVGNIIQSQIGSIFTSCVENAVANASATQKMQATLSQSATAKSEGVSIWAIVALVGIVVFGIVSPIAFVGSSIFKYFYIILIIAGIAMIVTYFLWQTPLLQITPYSAGFAASSGCVPGGATTPVTTYKTPIDAANECDSNPNYAGFEWIGFQPTNANGTIGLQLAAPLTTFYTSIDPACSVVSDPNLSLFRTPTFTSGLAPPTSPNNQDGDYYVQTTPTNFQGWIFKVGSGWTKDTVWAVPAGMLNIVFGTGSPTTSYPATTIYADVSNPKICPIYVSGNTVGSIVGPGYAPITTTGASGPQYTNTSGFKAKSTKPWLLYVGGASVAMGFISMIISLVYSQNTAKKVTDVPKNSEKIKSAV